MIRVRRGQWLRLGVLVVLVATLGVAPAQAQDEGPFREPGISYLEEKGPYIEWGFGALIVIACLLIAFKNPHRTHMD